MGRTEATRAAARLGLPRLPPEQGHNMLQMKLVWVGVAVFLLVILGVVFLAAAAILHL
jgi:cytochrome oxidase assembly protein ShyY1